MNGIIKDYMACDGLLHTSSVPFRCYCGGGVNCQARKNLVPSTLFYGRHHYVNCGDIKYCAHCGRIKVFTECSEENSSRAKPFIKFLDIPDQKRTIEIKWLIPTLIFGMAIGSQLRHLLS